MNQLKTLKGTLLFIMIYLCSTELNAQVTVNSDVAGLNGSYSLNGTFNGKNRYSNIIFSSPLFSLSFDIIWNSSSGEWEFAYFLDGVLTETVATNSNPSDPNPPCSSLNPWVVVNNPPFGITTLGITGSDCVPGIFPVSWGDFKGESTENGIQLFWETASEINNAGFWLERSYNTEEWERIEFIKGVGNSQVNQFYTFLDDQPYKGTNYYQLRQVDFDGNTDLSELIGLDYGLVGEVFSIYPNPVNRELNFSLPISNKDEHLKRIQVFDLMGSLHMDFTLKPDEKSFNVKPLLPGNYLVKFYTNQKILIKRFIRKN